MKDYKKICADCPCLIEKNKVWCCDECFGQKCEDLDECPEGITLEEMETIEEKTKDYKINVGHKKPAERKPKEKKKDIAKEEIIAVLAKTAENFAENVQITNISKVIEFDLNGEHYKLDLIRQRKPKN